MFPSLIKETLFNVLYINLLFTLYVVKRTYHKYEVVL